MKMKAAILIKQNSPLIIDELEIPILKMGQVLVRVYASGICGKQIGEISGDYGPDPYIPHLLGHEGAGVVEDVGEGISHVAKGDHVVIHWRCGEGINSVLPKYERINGHGFIGSGANCTFQEYSIVSENRLTIIYNDLHFDVASLFGCSITTGLGIVENDAQLKMGQSIAVMGCGGIGLNVIQGAFLISANPIIAIDIKEEKLKMARNFGASHSINSFDDDFREEIKKIVGKKGVNVFVDCTGNPEIIAKGYELMASGGRMIMVGVPRFDQDLVLPRISRAFTGKQLIASQGGQCRPNEDIPRYLHLYREGKLNLDDLITHRFPLEKINEALEVVRSGKAGRCMISLA